MVLAVFVSMVMLTNIINIVSALNISTNLGEATSTNPIVYCGKCSVGVHKECYGNPLGRFIFSLILVLCS